MASTTGAGYKGPMNCAGLRAAWKFTNAWNPMLRCWNQDFDFQIPDTILQSQNPPFLDLGILTLNVGLLAPSPASLEP